MKAKSLKWQKASINNFKIFFTGVTNPLFLSLYSNKQRKGGFSNTDLVDTYGVKYTINGRVLMKWKKSIIIVLLIILLGGIIALKSINVLSLSKNKTGDMSATMYVSTGLDEEYWTAYKNCLNYMEDSGVDQTNIVLNRVVFNKLSDDEIATIEITNNNKNENMSADTSYWSFMIGESSGDYITIICNSGTSDVIGYNPAMSNFKLIFDS